MESNNKRIAKNTVMLPQTFNEEDPPWNDIKKNHQLENKINSNKVVVIPDTYSSDIQQSIIKYHYCPTKI